MPPRKRRKSESESDDDAPAPAAASRPPRRSAAAAAAAAAAVGAGAGSARRSGRSAAAAASAAISKSFSDAEADAKAEAASQVQAAAAAASAAAAAAAEDDDEDGDVVPEDPFVLLQRRLFPKVPAGSALVPVVALIRAFVGIWPILPPRMCPGSEFKLDPNQTPIVFTRPSRVWDIQQWLEERIVGLARGAPGCGKSVMLALLEHAYQVQGWRVLKCDLLHVGDGDEGFKSKWLKDTGESLAALNDITTKTVLLVDEIQSIFSADLPENGAINKFFKMLRHWGNTRHPCARALCFGTFPDVPGGTADAFKTVPEGYRQLGLSDLRMKCEEFRLYLNIRARETNDAKVLLHRPLSRQTRNTLWKLGYGHFSITVALLHSLDLHFKDPKLFRTAPERNHTKKLMQWFLTEPATHAALRRTTRSFGCVDKLMRALKKGKPPEYLRALQDAVKFALDEGATIPDRKHGGAAREEELNTLFRVGFISPVNGVANLFCFVAPVMRTMLVELLGRRVRTMPTSCRDLAVLGVRAMRKSVLRAIRDDHNESTFSKEFFAAMISLLPDSVTPRSEVIADDGRIDYLIDIDDDTRWGIELLVDGDKRKKHIDRFADHGIYAQFELDEWAIIDFRRFTGAKLVKSQYGDENTFTVEFLSNAYAEVNIWVGSLTASKKPACLGPFKLCTELQNCECPAHHHAGAAAAQAPAAAAAAAAAPAAPAAGAKRKREGETDSDDAAGADK